MLWRLATCSIVDCYAAGADVEANAPEAGFLCQSRRRLSVKVGYSAWISRTSKSFIT